MQKHFKAPPQAVLDAWRPDALLDNMGEQYLLQEARPTAVQKLLAPPPELQQAVRFHALGMLAVVHGRKVNELVVLWQCSLYRLIKLLTCLLKCLCSETPATIMCARLPRSQVLAAPLYVHGSICLTSMHVLS